MTWPNFAVLFYIHLMSKITSEKTCQLEDSFPFKVERFEAQPAHLICYSTECKIESLTSAVHKQLP